MLCILAAAFAWDGLDPLELVRVEDPDHPDAILRSETGSVILGPPAAGIPWRREPVAETDRSPAFEGLAATNADLWHDEGHIGEGVRVAVFDPAFGDADVEELGPFTTYDCTAHRTCEVPFDPVLQGASHGVACAEVLRDLAPGIELFLVKTGSFTSFENGVHWAIRNDIDLVSMSVSFYNDSFHDGTGPFGPLLQELEDHDVLLVTSAGNTARQHWDGRFVDADGDGRLDFGGDNRLEFDVNAGSGRRVTLNWDQHRTCGLTDLDLRVVDLEGDVWAVGEDDQIANADRCQPTEIARFDVEQSQRMAVEVWLRRGGVSGLDLSIFTRNATVVDGVEARSITVPADHPLAFAVGAVRADEYLTAGAESFSSHGPNAAGWAKPDLVGPDRLSTDVFGASGFTGTSAATPAVAALIAVRMSADPGSTPREAADWLRRQALSDRPVWDFDPELGGGRARLPNPDPVERECGRRPLLMWLVLVPLWRRRVRCVR